MVNDDEIKLVLISREPGAVKAFVNDPAYAKYSQARQAGSISRFHVIDDTDVAGAIPYLAKG